MKADTTHGTDFYPFEEKSIQNNEEEFYPFSDEDDGNVKKQKGHNRNRLDRTAGKRKIKNKRLFICFLLVQAVDQATARCTDTIKSVDIVQSCPTNAMEWQQRAKLKGCSKIMKHCVDSNDFVYHCLINTHIDQTVEVCAKPIMANGFCCEFNKIGELVQIHLKADCKLFKVPCSVSYWSNASYLYQGCYQLVYEERVRQTKMSLRQTMPYSSQKPIFNFKGENVNKSANDCKDVFYLVIAVFIFIFVLLLFFFKNH